MRKLPHHSAALLAIAAPGIAHAGVYSDDLTKCVVRSATEADQLGFMRFMFAALSTNPALQDMASVKPEKVSTLTKSAALMMDRIIFTDCRQEVVAALKYEGNGAVEAAFNTFGNVAARNLMTNPETQKTMAALQQFGDHAKFEQLAKDAGLTPAAPTPPK